MPSLFQPARRSRFRIILAGKNKSNVIPLIADGHPVRKRILPRDPADVHPGRFINPRTCDVEGLVAQRLNHAQKLRLSPRAGLLGNQSDDSRHVIPYVASADG